MKTRLLSIVLALLMLCSLFSFSILATDIVPGENETEDFPWGNIATYTVTLPTGTGYTVATEDELTVEEGDSFSFTVAIADGYVAGDDFAVKANGTALEAVDGVYTIANITADQKITVEGVVEDVPAVMMGDVDGNGSLNVNDALTLFRYIAKQPNVVINGTNGDVDGSGSLNVNDALTLFRYIAKQPNVTIVWGVLTPLA